MDLLVQIDTKLFYLFNVHLQNGLFDVLMPFLTNKKNWFIPIGILWLYLIIKGGKTGRVVAVLIILTITLSDQTSSHLLKPLFGRTRPCNILENINLLARCRGSFSFPSSHATNMFATATLFSSFYGRNVKILWILFASAVAYSRVYVGVHYPFDILFGAFVGVICGLVIVKLWTLGEIWYTNTYRQKKE